MAIYLQSGTAQVSAPSSVLTQFRPLRNGTRPFLVRT